MKRPSRYWLDYLDDHQARFVNELPDFVRIPSV